MSAERFAIVADIGGTNTRVALARGAEVLTGTVARYRNTDHKSLRPILLDFMGKHPGAKFDGVCVALAGPVQDGHGQLTNLNWDIEEAMLAQTTDATNVSLLNDLQAQGHAIGHLQDGTARQLIDAPATPAKAAKLVIGIGTGFNIAPVFESPEGRIIPASEAGHTGLPAHSEDELRFAAHLEETLGYAATEDMLSGRGFERLYRWLAHESGQQTDKSAAQIMQGFEAGSDPLAAKAAAMFVQMVGSVAGNLALTTLPFGGIYFAGGVARAFAPHFEVLGFAQAFRNKGRFAAFMERFSVQVIEDDYAALTGCARFLASRSLDRVINSND